MTWKRCIALVLCALYLSATVGTALASLTCKCLGMKAHAAHLCTGHCHAGPETGMVSGAETSWKNNAVSGAESRTVEDRDRTEEPEACCDVCPGCALRACCGCDLHSIEINLYTASHSDDSEKYVRCIVAELPPSMAAECVQPLSFAVSSGNEILRKQPLPQDVVLSIRGLRAPPALA